MNDLGSGDIKVETCSQCCEFLKEVHRFRTEPDIKTEAIKVNSSSDTNQDCQIYQILHSKRKLIILIEKCDEANPSSIRDKSYKCDQCDYSCKSHHGLNRHKHSHLQNRDKPYKCTECSFTTVTLRNIKNHVRRRHCDDKPLKCDQCNYCTNIERDLQNHRKTHVMDCDKSYKCTECSYATISLSRLNIHIQRKHSDNKPFSCDQCNYRASLGKDLKQHKKVHLMDHEKPNKCTECSYRTVNKTNLKLHYNSIHSNDRPFKCDLCDYRCKLSTTLSYHKGTHLEKRDKPFKCTECSFTTLSGYRLKSHTTLKHKNKQAIKQDHKRHHLKEYEKPFKCTECSFTTTALRYMRNHMKCRHDAEKRFSCDHCDYRGMRKRDMLYHMKTHFSNPYFYNECGECSYKSVTMLRLKRHILNIHGHGGLFSCEHCDYSGHRKTDLSRHMKIHFKRGGNQAVKSM